MRKCTFGLVALLCFGLVAAGCAKKEMVKPEEAVPPVAAPQPTTPAKPAAPPVKEEPIAAQPIPEAPVKTETLQPATALDTVTATLDRIFFDFDSFVLSQAARDILSKNAEYLLKKQPNARVLIEGHCDERGSDEYNLALGEKRAKAARDYLVTLGVAANRLSIISYGEEKPLDPGHTEEAWAKNRRAEFLIVK
ncbi:peptidoglycan-associated lipoprotein [Geobacter metallireducens RCH3]|uniref:Peptidoglycan-associated lipoprotein n=1 Tax=Geobacter metallireducens (strain ATCC 53774 / DSM 7210 / GS-15) TaxID=269799 RepID=Q39PS8_GEOMG|nr:peptidoglycan-associated lipoprotein Pal [Geobacter metallireducens]ABB33746.1 peptidoglycan-binding outer membrane lipoprotein Pal, OmpA family [Geobacter metallireducens GS-15]EHP85726.1 peptidoglycan-associated lipoprotein [Geobacter metallireducens RCH3]